MRTTTTTSSRKRAYGKGEFAAALSAADRARFSKRRRTPLPYQVRQRAPVARRVSAVEVKSFDSIVAGGALPLIAATVGAEPAAVFAGITELNCVQQGATVANRIGNKIVIRSIHLKCAISAVANLCIARLMIVYDKQPNGAFPAITDILLDQPAGAGSFYGGLNIANKSRFQIIRDAFHTIDPGQAQIQSINLYCKGRWESEYGANAGNIGDFRTGAVYLVAFYAVNPIILSPAACRIRYYD